MDTTSFRFQVYLAIKRAEWEELKRLWDIATLQGEFEAGNDYANKHFPEMRGWTGMWSYYITQKYENRALKK